MAQVPYDPVQQVAAEDERIRRPEVPELGAAFGTNIGQSQVKLGGAAQAGGDELFRTALWLQNLNNESTARDVSIKATQEMAERTATFDSLEGKARHDNLPQYLKDLNDIRTKYRGTLNPVAAKMYDAEAASLQNRFTAQGALSAGRGLKDYTVETARAHRDVISNTWADPFDDEEFHQKSQQIAAATRTVVENSPGGFSQDAYEDALQKEGSKLWVDRINIVSQTDVNRAFDMLNTARAANEILPGAEKAIYDQLIIKNRAQGGDYLAKKLYDPNKPLTKLEDDVRNAAKDPELSRNDPLFEEQAVKAMQLKYNQAHHAQIMDRASAKQTLDDAINTGKYRTEADVRADPNLASALQQDPSYDPVRTLSAYWTKRDNITNETNFRTLARMADTDPTRFLQQDLWELPMSDGQRGKLMAARKQIINANGGARNDPQVDKASAAIRRIFPNSVPRSGTDDYLVWQGALQGALEDYQAGVGRKLTLDDYEKIGRTLTSTAEHTGWFGTNVGAAAIYDAPIEQSFLDHYRTQGMPDDEIATLYHRTLAIQKFNRLFSGTTTIKKSPAGAAEE